MQPSKPYILKVPWDVCFLTEFMTTGHNMDGITVQKGLPPGAMLRSVEYCFEDDRVYFYYLLDPDGVTNNAHMKLEVIDCPIEVRKETVVRIGAGNDGRESE